MSLTLDKSTIYNILKERKLKLNKTQLITYLNFAKHNFIRFTKNSNNKFGTEKHINPTLWQMGHVIFFYTNLVINNLRNCENIKLNNYDKYVEFYDSYLTPLECRDSELLLDYNTCIKYYNKVMEILSDYITVHEITNIESYLILLGIVHNEMHNEAFVFTQMNLNPKFDLIDVYYENEESMNLIKEIEFVDYYSDTFIQGSDDDEKLLIFDNEMPSFKRKIDYFKISKYPITEYQYLQFVKSQGYQKEIYWCNNGYKWKNKNKIELPLYWVNENNNYFKYIGGIKSSLETNLPIMNISYYEAMAYCKWANVRLPYEYEYEYVATNGGTTKFPWGNNNDNMEDYCNINYTQFIVQVDKYEKGNNNRGISQLIGNVWEWCQESIYTYDGFKIDPVYREMSYPFFGFKKICKGGCFAVPNFLIHPKYRNAQYPDCRIQFIGFRVCK